MGYHTSEQASHQASRQVRRREFLMLSAFAGAGLTFELFPAQAAFAGAGAAEQRAFSFGEAESLTPLAVADDCIGLAAAATSLAAPLRHSLTVKTAVVHVSGLLSDGRRHVVPLLAECRERWAARRAGDFTEEKLALAAGWLIHKATRETFQPLFKKLGDEPTVSECRLYHDVTLLGELRGEQGGQRAVSRQDLSDLFRAMSQRLMIRLHTFEPDEEDADGWLGRLFAWRARQQALFGRLAEIYHSPDAAKERRYVGAVNFYNREDALIRAARAMRRGALPATGGIEAAAQASASQSLYARALARGWGYQQTVGDFLERRIDEAQLKSRLSLEAIKS
jgi:hypothetical protein